MLTHRARLMLVLLLGWGSFACGDDSGVGGNGADSTGGGAFGGGGSDGGAGGEGALAEPEAGITDCAAIFVDDDGACRPKLEKCPLGSIPDVDTGCVEIGVVGCAPEFVDARGVCLPAVDDCPAGSFPVPTQGCMPIDGPLGCGAGTWGNVADDAINVYVDASYVGAISDGSKAQPFVALPDALVAAAPGSRIVMAAGEYSTSEPITTELELRGVCASQVTLTAAADAERVLTLDAPGETIRLSDVTVSASVAGIRVQSGNAEITRVHVRDVSYIAIEVGGAFTTALIDQSLVQDTINGGDEEIGMGVRSTAGAELTIQQSAIIRARTVALQASDATLLADDVFVADTLSDGTGYGNAASSQSGGELTVRRSVLRDNFGGVYVGAEATVEESVLGVVFDSENDKISVLGGSLSLLRSAAVDGDTWAITVYAGETGPVLIEHVLVADIASGTYGGSGISLSEPATLRRSAFTRNIGSSITAVKNTEIDGVVLEDLLFDSSIGVGSGIVALDGGLISIDRSYFRGVEDAAVILSELNGSAGAFSLTRSRIEALPGTNGFGGLGVGLSAPNVPATIQNVVIEDVRSAGVFAIDTSLVMERSIVRGVAPNNLSLLTPESDDVGPIADGVLFVGTSADHGLALSDVWIEGAERGGFTASAGAHTLARVRIAGSEVGVALRDEATATQTDCDLQGNDVAAEDPTDLLVPE